MLTRCLRAQIDNWDEVAAAKEDRHKVITPFALDASLAFPDLSPTANAAVLATAAGEAVAKASEYYSGPQNCIIDLAKYDLGWLSFSSAIYTENSANNIVFARVFEGNMESDVVILVPHWNCKADSLFPFAKYIHWMGYTSVVLVLPYHHQRRRPESDIADYFVSASLGRTIRSVRQAVVDLRGVIDWLEIRGHHRFYVIGASLGSCVAGLASAVDQRIRASHLLLTAGSFADVVWTGRATRHISAALQEAIPLEVVRRIWSIISLDSFVEAYRNNSQKLLVLSAARDQVIRKVYTEDFIDKLRASQVSIHHVCLPCGHYSLGMFPFSVGAAARVVGFLRSVSR